MQKIKLAKWGNSNGIRISKDLLKNLDIFDSEISDVEFLATVVDGKLILERVQNTAIFESINNLNKQKDYLNKEQLRIQKLISEELTRIDCDVERDKFLEKLEKHGY